MNKIGFSTTKSKPQHRHYNLLFYLIICYLINESFTPYEGCKRNRSHEEQSDESIAGGSDTSLKESPTLAPVTAALWLSESFPPWHPASMHYLTLSCAPPEFVVIITRSGLIPMSIQSANMLSSSSLQTGHSSGAFCIAD